jgi:hypothetical protein
MEMVAKKSRRSGGSDQRRAAVKLSSRCRMGRCNGLRLRRSAKAKEMESTTTMAVDKDSDCQFWKDSNYT